MERGGGAPRIELAVAADGVAGWQHLDPDTPPIVAAVAYLPGAVRSKSAGRTRPTATFASCGAGDN
jgi:hypothetical protein